MEFDEIVVKESPGLCRCCLSEGCYKDMGTEYSWMNENEVYADMLFECFDISISQLNDGPNGPNRLICEVCITRLRDACYFKKQVLESEKKFVDMVGRGEFKPKGMVTYQSSMKTEKGEDVEVTFEADEGDVEYLEDEMDYLDDEPLKTEEPSTSVSDVTAEALPLRTKRGRPRKAPAKPAKKVKPEPKAKTSKALVKETESTNRENAKKYKADLLQILTVIVGNSTIMPFRWHCNKYMCFFCGCLLDNYLKLKQHTKSKHEEPKSKNILAAIKNTRVKLDVSEISCKRCSKCLHSLEDFLAHAATAYDLKFNRDLSKDFFIYKLSEGDLNCLECEESFRFFGPLMMHTHKYHNKSNTEYVCEICGRRFARKLSAECHIKSVHGPHKCNKCDKEFPSRNDLKVHLYTVHKDGELKCPKCPKIFTSRYLKKRHLALDHNVQSSQHKCDLCPMICTNASILLVHKARVHLKVRYEACSICGFEVFDKEELKRHMVKHDGSRPFQCDICEKSFQRKKTLIRHKQTHLRLRVK